VTPAKVSVIAQTLPLLSSAKSNSSPQEEKTVSSPSPNAGAVLPKESKPASVDTISISRQSRQAMTDVNKKEVPIEQPKREEPKKENGSVKSDRTTDQVQFVYDLNGDLNIRYMDSANRLIYQVPSELMIHLAEALSKSGPSVNTNA